MQHSLISYLLNFERGKAVRQSRQRPFFPILPNDQDHQIVVNLQALKYMLFSRNLKDLMMKALMVNMATIKLRPWLQGVMLGDLLFLINRFEMRLKAC